MSCKPYLCLSIGISDIAEEEENFSGILFPESPESPLWFVREHEEKYLVLGIFLEL